MSKPMQGADTGTCLALRFLRKTAILLVVAGSTHGCAMFGGGGIEAIAPDEALTTSSVPKAAAPHADGALAADTRAMLAALAAGEPSDDMAALTWENPDSGARGLITAYNQQAEDGRNCLAFTTTRESFDGVGLYDGKACKDSAGILRLRGLSPL